MMARPPTRDDETRDLIQRFQAKRERRRKLRIVAGVIGGVALLALVIAVVMLLVRGPGDGETAATPTVASTAPSGPTSTSANTAAGAPGASSTDRAAPTSSSTTTLPTSTTTTAPVTTTSSTTTSIVTTTTAAPATTTTSTRPTSLVVVLDPGHQARGDSSTEPIGPGSSEKKAKVSSGTAGAATGIPESELVLAVSLRLRDALVAQGIQVVMTRTTQDVNISNVQRAQMANEAGADLFVRIHADGSDNSGTAGIHVLYPASVEGWTDDIAAESKQAAAIAQKELIVATGAKDRGIDARSDMSGFNWSDVPVILPEIGFMTNPAEDRLLATPAYQDKIVQGLTRAILSFLGVS